MSELESTASATHTRTDLPWPALALAAVGAWLCTLFLALAMVMMFQGVNSAPPRIVMGGGFVAAALLSLRVRSASAFVEQLFLPLFAVGVGTLAWALPNSVAESLRMGLVGSLCLAVAIWNQRATLQTLLGAVGVAGCLGAIAHGLGLREWSVLTWLVTLIAVACWWLAQRVSEQRWKQTWARIGSGGALLALVFAAWQSGWALGAGQAVGAGGGITVRVNAFGSPEHLLSVVAGMAFVILNLVWVRAPASTVNGLSKPAQIFCLGAIASLCLLQPWFGLCLGLAWCAAAWGHRGISGAAAFAALWTVLAIYGLQQPSFNVKALMLAAAGALLLAAAFAIRPRLGVTVPSVRTRTTPWALMASVVAVGLVVGYGTVEKERIRMYGETVLVPLAPVDPRSIMQGDYMTLGFDLGLASLASDGERTSTDWVGQLGPREGVDGVLQKLRHQAKGQALASNERRVRVSFAQNRVSMPTNAFFFAEGTGSRFEAARFGVFKLGAKGDSVLVGLADAKGQRIEEGRVRSAKCRCMIPPESFDLRSLSPEFFRDPYPTYAALRQAEPIKRMPDGSLFLTRHADLCAVYRDAASFSSAKFVEFAPKYGQGSLLYTHHTTSLVFNDAPAHTRVRRLLMGALTRRAVEHMEPGLVRLVDGLLDEIESQGGGDVVEDFAAAIPVEVIGNLLGVPHADRGPLRAWSLAILGALEPALTALQLQAGHDAVRDFRAYLVELVKERQKQPGDPEHDVLTRLIQGQRGADGGVELLADEELLQNCIFILNAGHETTTNLIANALVTLAQHQEARAQMLYISKQRNEQILGQKRENASKTAAQALEGPFHGLLDAAVDEFLRFESSNQLGNRRAVKDFELAGERFGAGTLLTLCIGAANRDPVAFDAPNALRLARHPNRHLAFGLGIHQCAGLSLARLEGRIAISRFLVRFPHFQLSAPPQRSQRVRFRGFVRAGFQCAGA